MAKAIAAFAEIPVILLQTYEHELAGAKLRASAKLKAVRSEERAQLEAEVESPAPILTLVMGPFDIVHDIRYTYWQAFKVVAADVTIASPLCRLDNQGTGGLILLKLWYRQQVDYQYHGDPAGDRLMHPKLVIRTICYHLADEYHVGFVSHADQGVDRAGVMQSNESLLESADEAEARAKGEAAIKRR
jgi:hypothetical protein